MSEMRKPLSSKERDNLDDADFAYIDSDGDRHLPIHDAAHVRAALSRFSQTQFDSDDDKKKAAKKIVTAAKKFDIEVDPSSAVGEAAGLKQQNSVLADVEMRRAVRESSYGVREERRCPSEFELREVANGTGASDLIFTGYASVFGKPYEMQDLAGEFDEEFSRGSCLKTTSEGCDTNFLLNHSGMSLARTKSGTLQLAEDSTGLHVEARLDPKNPLVVMMRSAIARGDMDEMSLAFRVQRQSWVFSDSSDDGRDHRYIQEVNLNQGDVSLVNYGANPHTGGLVAIRSKGDVDWPRMFDEFACAVQELRIGAKHSADTVGRMQQIASHLGTSDTAAARAILQQMIDEAASGAAGNTETESAKPSPDAIARAYLLMQQNREAEKKRKAA